eukprot:scaffold657_cov561-Prasinococcus_capsulatus_cf.AAC.1
MGWDGMRWRRKRPRGGAKPSAALGRLGRPSEEGPIPGGLVSSPDWHGIRRRIGGDHWDTLWTFIAPSIAKAADSPLPPPWPLSNGP